MKTTRNFIAGVVALLVSVSATQAKTSKSYGSSVILPANVKIEAAGFPAIAKMYGFNTYFDSNTVYLCFYYEAAYTFRLGVAVGAGSSLTPILAPADITASLTAVVNYPAAGINGPVTQIVNMPKGSPFLTLASYLLASTPILSVNYYYGNNWNAPYGNYDFVALAYPW